MHPFMAAALRENCKFALFAEAVAGAGHVAPCACACGVSLSKTKHSVSNGLSQLELCQVVIQQDNETDCLAILIPAVLVQHTNQQLTS